jgi:hypothetical protein
VTTPTRDLCIITCYYNPNGFKSRRNNYDQFVAGLERFSVPYVVVECACRDAEFELPLASTTIRVRAPDVLWQKERLLNIALAQLPPTYTKVAWLDCDLLFEDPAWIHSASLALERLPVIQPFNSAACLSRFGQTQDVGGDAHYVSFAAVCSAAPELVTAGEFWRHGHTGFGWAARRELLVRHGFYDACLTGSGDHLMAHAMFGDWRSRCVDYMLGSAPSPYRRHFERWAKAFHADVGGRVGHIPGRVLHLWHGEATERHYHLRNQQFRAFGFDPEHDLRVGLQGAWEWASPKSALHHWARAFFTLRNEDAAFNFVSSSGARTPQMRRRAAQ